ncbi:MAG: FeoB-associated Cys-rich membrane protein [Tannerellaceae bacterium]|jgi:hypothetical protein|nr:FeoB-associated Cys-rich membrane protein [Tannerellaceae bacterium]
MLFQEIAVIIIGLLAVGYVGRKVYRLFFRPEASDPCAGCPGCALKEGMNREKCPDTDN